MAVGKMTGGTLARQQTDRKSRVKNVTWGPENISCQPRTQSFKNMDTVAKTICGAPGVDSESDKLCRFIAARYSISVGSKQRGKVLAVAPVQNTIFDETAKRTREFLARPQWIQKATNYVKWPLHIPDQRQGSRNDLRFVD